MNPHPWPSDPHSQPDWQLARLRRYLEQTVLPFSAHYGALFRRHGLDVSQLRTLDDLRRIPFTSKSHFLPQQATRDPV